MKQAKQNTTYKETYADRKRSDHCSSTNANLPLLVTDSLPDRLSLDLAKLIIDKQIKQKQQCLAYMQDKIQN
jgi:hypothetical protein